MRKLLSILIVLMLFNFVGCNNRLNETLELNGKEINIYEKMNLPTLKVIFDTENILVKKGGYNWDTGKESIIADSESPDQIADKMEGTEVKPESELMLDFSKKPNKVNVIDWSKLKNNSYTFDNDKIIVPKEEGTYIYEIIAEWEQGQVSFTIKVIVSKE